MERMEKLQQELSIAAIRGRTRATLGSNINKKVKFTKITSAKLWLRPGLEYAGGMVGYRMVLWYGMVLYAGMVCGMI